MPLGIFAGGLRREFKVIAENSVLANLVWVCEAWTMAKKRTKLDKSERQADRLEKRAETRPEQTPKKRTTVEDLDQAAAQVPREVNE
jgi:hypothetical protein